MLNINKSSDSDILDYLMTSDFNDNIKPEEFIFLLSKWRYFYRILHGKYKVVNDDIDTRTTKYEDIIKIKDREINNLIIEKTDKQNIINNISSRKLTLMERLTGKIKIEEGDISQIK